MSEKELITTVMSEKESNTITENEMNNYEKEYEELIERYNLTYVGEETKFGELKDKVEYFFETIDEEYEYDEQYFKEIYNICKLLMVVDNKDMNYAIKKLVLKAKEENIEISSFYNENEIKKISKKIEDELLNNIEEIDNEGDIHTIYLNCDLDEIEDKSILKLIYGDDNDIGKVIGEGGEAEVFEYGDKAIRISKEQPYKANQRLATSLECTGDSSTLATNVIKIVDDYGKAKVIEVYEKKNDLKKILESEKTKKSEKINMPKVVGQLLDAVENLHINGVIHRDIKLDNILYKDGNISIADLNTAINFNEELIDISGTLFYTAPELFLIKNFPHLIGEERKLVNVKNDVYSLGATLLEMFTKSKDGLIYDKFKEYCREKQTRESLTSIISFRQEFNIHSLITTDNIVLSKFLPEEVIENADEKDLEQLKVQIVILIQKMTAMNPDDRFTITEAKKEYRKIEKFVEEKFAIVNRQTEFDEKKIEFKNNIDKIKKKNGENKQDEILWEKPIIQKNKEEEEEEIEEEISEEEKEKLRNIFHSFAEEKYNLSKNTIDCLEILEKCIDENGNVNLPSEEFYTKYDGLRQKYIESKDKLENINKNEDNYSELEKEDIDNKRNYFLVKSNLIKLREIKLKIEIGRLKKLQNTVGKDNKTLDQELKNLKELLDDTRLATTTYNDKNMAENLFVKNIEIYNKKEEYLRNFGKRIEEINKKVQEEQKIRDQLKKVFQDKIKKANKNKKGFKVLMNKKEFDEFLKDIKNLHENTENFEEINKKLDKIKQRIKKAPFKKNKLYMDEEDKKYLDYLVGATADFEDDKNKDREHTY